MSTKYGVYIIESLRSEDYFDGENLYDILKLSRINSKYFFVDSKGDFIDKLEGFKNSKFRYLHLSCHADDKGIEINCDKISYIELSSLLKGKINGKRLFMSACRASNKNIAARAIVKNGAVSLIGTPFDLPFDKSALFWPSFYHIINERDLDKMESENIKWTIKNCVDLFGVPINYYTKIKGRSNKIRRYKFRKGEEIENKIITVTTVIIRIDARSKLNKGRINKLV